MRMRTAAIKRRRKGVEFLVGPTSNSFLYFRKKNLVNFKRGQEKDDMPVDA
ncbi:MAG: hypothetical protein WBG50_12260 [Desulfomonilaceae bacterium]